MNKTSYSRRPIERLATALASGSITDDLADRMLAVKNGSNKSTMPAIFNLKDSSIYVGVSEGHFRRLADEGIFPPITLGRSRWWRRVDLDRALESRAIQSGRKKQAT